MFTIIKKAWKALNRSTNKTSPEQGQELKSFFLNYPKEIAEKKHPLLAWAYHVHAQMLSFYQDTLDTPTFCETTQMRSWQKANQIALSILEDKPMPLPLDAKAIRLEEITALREDVRAMDKQLEMTDPQLAVLAAQRYLAWSILYFEHFPLSGINQELLLEIDMLAEQASIMAHPYLSPEECQTLKRQVANSCLQQSAWEMPLWSPDELLEHVKTKVASEGFRNTLTHQATQAKIALRQREARDYLSKNQAVTEASQLPERAASIRKIKELQNLLDSKPLY